MFVKKDFSHKNLNKIYKWDHKHNKAVPKPEEKGIADKIMTALLVGFMIPAILTSPFGLFAIAAGASRYYFRKSDFNREIQRLRKRGYVSLTKTEEGWLLKLLPKGMRRAKQVAIETLKLDKPKVWDEKWRLFSFDIPEEFKTGRNQLRAKLKSLGCYNIQRSLFAYPYVCRKELEIGAEYYNFGKYTLFTEVFNLSLDKELRKVFSLK